MKNLIQELPPLKLLNARRLHRLLVILRMMYPIGLSIEGIKDTFKSNLITRSNLKDLINDGLIIKKDIPIEFKKTLNPNFTKYYPEYIITTKGMDFVNGIEVHKLSNKVGKLTNVIVGLTIILIGLSIIQIVLSP